MISKIIKKIEDFAPPELACSWDNSGWQIRLENNEIKKVLLALSPTLDVIDQAIEKNCGLIITHHPLIFGKLTKITPSNQTNIAIIKAIQNNIQIYSAHTNLDSTCGGIADKLAEMLNLKNIHPANELGEDSNFLRYGEFESEMALDDFVNNLKNILKIDKIKLINPAEKDRIRRIAVCPGSGGDFIRKIKNADLYLTSDIRYHNALETDDMIVVDAGHMETERIILSTIKDLIQSFNIEIILAEETPPWKII